MSWQDDLRQLDQSLAEGRVSADDYRRRRDQLLATAAAAGSPAPAEQPQPPAATPPQPPTPPPAPQQQGAGGPFAPPFRWEPSPDATQVVSATGSAGDNADPTQVVRQPHSPESDRTQTLRPVTNPSQFNQPPPWQTQQPAPPPWGAEDDGPVAMPSTMWHSHGPEVFESDGAGAKRGKIVWIAVAVVIVVGLGVGAFFLFGNSGGTPNAGGVQTQTSAPPTSTTPKKDDLSIANLEGTPGDFSKIKTFADAEEQGFLTPDEYRIYKDGDPGKARMAATTLPDAVKAYIFTAELGTPQKAATASNSLSQQQVAFGMKKRDVTQTGVLANYIENSGTVPATIRAHYVFKSTVVRIQVHGSDMAKVTAAFDAVLQAQLDTLAATG